MDTSLLMETHSTPLSSVAKSSAAANDTHEMETDDKELPEDLLVDDVTMIPEAEDEDDAAPADDAEARVPAVGGRTSSSSSSASDFLLSMRRSQRDKICAENR